MVRDPLPNACADARVDQTTIDGEKIGRGYCISRKLFRFARRGSSHSNLPSG
jgi:hypothetical protein